MIAAIVICALTCVLMIAGVLFVPKIRIGAIGIDSYWVVTTIGAVIAVLVCKVDFSTVGKALIADTSINPVKILALFISMTVMSIFLDELGFFRYLAVVAIGHSRTGQIKLFLILYFVVAVLTVFTSNDIIILSFTPFICYFAKNVDIDPVPYLAAEFVAANTWSMLFIIGNPTNIYLATASGLGFLEYLKYSFLPTVFGGAVSLGALLLVFGRKLKEPLTAADIDIPKIEDKLSFAVGIVHLSVCTVLLAIGSYINAEMWLIAVCSVGSLILFSLIISLARREKPRVLGRSLSRTPYQLVPFVLSMFALIVVLDEVGVTAAIGEALGSGLQILKYGPLSFLASNLINNIPMSVLFSSIIGSTGGAVGIGGLFATIVGSNVGAFFTPIGALAGIMWSSIINKHNIRFGYGDFLKIGASVAVPTLAASLCGVYLATIIF